MMKGFYRLCAATPSLTLGDVEKNLTAITACAKEAAAHQAAAIVFPELCLTTYSCNDLFFQSTLQDSARQALVTLCKNLKECPIIVIVGLPLVHAGALYNVAAVLERGHIRGFVPKSYLPNHREFYEKRYFTSGLNMSTTLMFDGQSIPFGTDLVFEDGDFSFGVEICEDMWSAQTPSTRTALDGALAIFNLSASNELVGKRAYRHTLVCGHAARLYAAYVYASSGRGESTSDTLFGGESCIAEFGKMIANNERFSAQNSLLYADIDFEKLANLRVYESTFADTPKNPCRHIALSHVTALEKLERVYPRNPFIPDTEEKGDALCEEIMTIQAHALAQRLDFTHSSCAVIGVSGGLDSTLALLAAHRAAAVINQNRQKVIAVSMPGFGTTSRTKSNAEKLCEALHIDYREISIVAACTQHLADLKHDLDTHDVVYENAQARERTQILMDMANAEHGLVIGTGDLSEAALGWCTYNGDHMAHYGVNSSLPKTLIRRIVRYAARGFAPETAAVLHDILATPVSPELLPAKDGEITQCTESLLGPYELHDFFLYHVLRYGAAPTKVYHLACASFSELYDNAFILKTLKTFYRRFTSAQFKRSCSPDGVKIGTVSLGRYDFRMPSDAAPALFLKELESITCISSSKM